ncbi:MAG: hypothetical protein E7620_00255 [Ruminococcaceae bacterium]|nr:hypothetical protein [Oscillospiraceae bacterium]
MKQTKRLLPFLLAVLVCVSALVPVTVTATEDPTFWYQTDFSDWTKVPETFTDLKAHYGLQALNSYTVGDKVATAEVPVSNVSDGVLNLWGTGGQAFFDIQYFDSNEWVNKGEFADTKFVTGDVTLSMSLKPLGKTWNRSNTDFLRFRNNKNGTASGWVSLFSTSNGAIKMSTNNGDVTSGLISTMEFTTLELMLSYDNAAGLYTNAKFYINGELLGEKTLSDANLRSIDHFRMFTTYDAGQGIALDSLAVVKGCVSLYEAEEEPDQGPSLWQTTDFSEWTKVSENYTDLKNYQGLQAQDSYRPGSVVATPEAPVSYVENGVLYLLNSGKNTGTQAFFDIQYWDSNSWTNKGEFANTKFLTGDFTLSMEMKPLGATWNRSDADFLSFRYNKSGSAPSNNLSNYQYFFTKDGKLGMKADGGDVLSGVLPTDSFTTLEVMFHWNETTAQYESLECYVNGVKLGSATIANPLAGIDHFRMFKTYTVGQGIALDSLTVVKGCESVYNASEKTTFAGYQTTAATNGVFDLRLVGVTTDANVSDYTKVGFDVEVKIGDKTLTKVQDITTVYEKIVATETAEGYKEYTAAELNGSYIFALNCRNIPVDQGVIIFTVTTYYQLGENATVAGETVTFTVDPATDIPQTEVK